MWALGGGIVALSRRDRTKVWDSLSFLGQCLFVGLVGSHLTAYFLSQYVTGVHPDWVLYATAGIIGWSGDRLERVRDAVIEWKLK